MIRKEAKRPGLRWAVGGCAVLLLAAIAVVVYSIATVSRMKSDLTDPAARDRKVREILGASDYPDGYGPMWALSVPLACDAAILSDVAPDEQGRVDEFDRGGYVHVRSDWEGEGSERLRRVYEGEAAFTEMLEAFRIRAPGFGMRSGDEIGRGMIDRQDVTIRYVASRGSFRMRHGAWREGVSTLLWMECTGEGEPSLGLWFQAPAEDDLSDPETVEAFTSRFSPCGR